MSGKQFRVTKGHKRGCFAVDAVRRGSWDTAWTFVRSSIVYRTASGTDGGKDRRGAHHRWHVLTCNDPACPATAMVREDVLAAAIVEVEAP